MTALISLTALGQTKPSDTTKVYMKFENDREQYGVKVTNKDSTSYYFIRYNRLVLVKKKVIADRPIPNKFNR